MTEQTNVSISKMVKPYKEMGLTKEMVLQGLIDSGLMQDIRTITAKGLASGIIYMGTPDGKSRYPAYPESIQQQLSEKLDFFLSRYAYIRERVEKEKEAAKEEKKKLRYERIQEVKNISNDVDSSYVYPHLKLNEFVVLDTETTGLTGDDEVIQVGITDMHGKELYSKWFYPEQEVNPYAAKVNHKTKKLLNGNPIFSESDWEEIKKVINGRPVLGHNIPFDKRLLSQTLKRYGISDDTDTVFAVMYDSKVLAKKWIRAKSYHLDDLATQVGITRDEKHEAVDDCKMTAEFIEKFEELIDMRIRSNMIKIR